MIEFRSKLRLPIRIHRWIFNRTEIEDRNRPAWNLNRRRFDSYALIALAYRPVKTLQKDFKKWLCPKSPGLWCCQKLKSTVVN